MPGSAAAMKRNATGRRRGRAPSHPARYLDLAKNGARRGGAATVPVKRGAVTFGIDHPVPADGRNKR